MLQKLSANKPRLRFEEKYVQQNFLYLFLQSCRIETHDYNLTVFKIHVGKLTLKLYDKGERTLRAEVVVHNTKELGCKRSLEYFEAMVVKLNELMGNFINNITYAHTAIIDDGTM